MYGLVQCLNPRARRSRVYYVTRLGHACQRRLHAAAGHDVPALSETDGVDWALYGWVCFNHRSTIIKVLEEPMQPVRVRRLARSRFPHVPMSSNNARDVIKSFLARGIVERVQVRGKHHPRYQLTDTGRVLQRWLWQADTPPPKLPLVEP